MESVDYFQVIKRHKWVIILAVIVTTLIAFWISNKQKPLYRTTAVVDVSVPGSGLLLGSSIYVGKEDMAEMVELEILRANNTSIAESVIERLGLNSTPEGLLSKITLNKHPKISAFTITAVDTHPERAARVANEFAHVVVEESNKNDIKGIGTTIKQVTRKLAERKQEIASLGKQIDTSKIRGAIPNPLTSENADVPMETYAEWSRMSASYNWLAGKIDELDLVKEGLANPLRIMQSAPVPYAPFQPATGKNTLIGLVAGLVLGLTTVFVLEYSDTSLRTDEELEKYFTIPVLGTVNTSTKEKVFKKDKFPIISNARPRSHSAEAYRRLRTNIQFLKDKEWTEDAKTLLLTNTQNGQEAAEALANLAAVFAIAGSKVIVLCCNLRNSMLNRFFKVESEYGLVNVLQGDKKIKDVMAPTVIPEILMVPSGVFQQNPHSPADLLSSSKMDQVISDLKDKADLILIDAPSIVEASDAAVLAQKVDAVLVVANVGEITRELATKARRLFDQVKAPLLGVIAFSKAPYEKL